MLKLWAYNATLSDESEEEESPDQDKFLPFVVPHVEEEDFLLLVMKTGKKSRRHIKSSMWTLRS
jgi:hypothetical protein